MEPLTIFAKKVRLRCWLGSENASDCYHCLLQYVTLLEQYFDSLFVVE